MKVQTTVEETVPNVLIKMLCEANIVVPHIGGGESINFPKIYQPPQNSMRDKGDMSKYHTENPQILGITILYYDQQMHNYFTNYHTPTCFDTIVSSSGSF